MLGSLLAWSLKAWKMRCFACTHHARPITATAARVPMWEAFTYVEWRGEEEAELVHHLGHLLTVTHRSLDRTPRTATTRAKLVPSECPSSTPFRPRWEGGLTACIWRSHC